jgi:cell division protein ZapD
MSRAAKAFPITAESSSVVLYEQPLNERMRTFLRLEFLYTQLNYHTAQQSAWSSRGAVSSLLDIVAILSRGDVRGDVLKELERQIFVLERLQRTVDIDADRLDKILNSLRTQRGDLNALGPKYLQELRDSEFLNAVRHRSSIPGGTCAFDLPEYTHWLRQGFERRSNDISRWITVVQPLCESVIALLWMLRNSKQATNQLAVNGVYQHSLSRDNTSALIRITLPANATMYPEVSGGQHRFTVRLMQWNATESRPEQIKHDVEFELAVC